MFKAAYSRSALATAILFSMIGIAVVPATTASAAGVSPPVLNPLTANVPGADVAAVQAFEATAVTQVRQSHALPSGDADAVLGWARDDVRAVEFADLTQIITEGAAKRSGTGVLSGGQDQLVYNWFQGVMQQQRIAAAQQGMNEFKRWSGLTSLTDASPLNYGPTQSFPGGYGNGSPVPTGFCGFSPPGGPSGPFAGTYSASAEEDCYVPCTDIITDCFPPEPDLSQFEQWGLYDAESKVFGTPDYMQASAGAAVAEGAGVAAALAGFTVPISTGIKAGPGTLLSRFLDEVAPNAVRTISRGATAIVAAGAEAAAEAGTVATETVTEVVAAATGALSVSLITGIVGVVIDFIISTVLAGITLNQQLTEPAQIQQVLTDAQTTPPNLETELSNTGGTAELFAAFVGSTLPESQTDCSVNAADACFTPPAPPSHTGSDPSFLVTPEAGGAGTVQNSLYSVDPLGLYFNSTYMSGNGWFVSRHYNKFDPANATVPTDGGATIQTLALPFTDWSGNHWSAERLTDAGGNTVFALTPLDEANAAACALLPNGSSPCVTDAIEIQVPGSGGVPYDATVRLISAATLAPTLNVTYTTPGTVGQAITFTPHGTDPSSLPLTYTWAFPVSGNQGCVLDPSNSYCGFTTTSSGTTSWTFHAPGDYEASVVATDSNNHSATQSFNVAVVAPTSTALSTSAAPAVSSQAVTFVATVTPSGGGLCPDVYFGPPVTGYVQFVVDGAKYSNPVELQHASCPVDGTRSASITIPNLAISAVGHAVTAQYLGSPEYTASSTSIAQVVSPETDATTITPSAATIVYGQAVSFKAAVLPVAPGTGRPTGTVQFYEDGNPLGSPAALGSDGTATSPVTTALNVNQVQLNLTDNVMAVYTGDATFPGTTVTFLEHVKSDPSKTTVHSSVSPSALGQPVSFTATVASVAPGSGTPTGCVQFAIDGVNVGSRVKLDASGAATFPATTSLSLTGAGTNHVHGHAVTATYLGLDGTCQSFLLNPRNLTSTGTLAPAQMVLAKGTPTVLGATVPATLTGAPFTFSFYKPVKGIDASARTNVNVTEVGHSAPIAATIVCKSAKLVTVSCAKGPVSVALLTPKTPLIAGEEYFTNVDRTGASIVSTVGKLKAPAYQGYVRSQVSFSAGQYPVSFAWGTVKSAAALGGSYVQDTFAGASVTTALSISKKSTPSVVLFKGPAQGIATVTVYKGATQVSTRQVDTYGSAVGILPQKLGVLAAGKYTVRVTVQGAKNGASTGYAVGLDAAIANGATNTTPVTTASWASIPDGLGGNYVFTTQAGATMSLMFRGTGVTMNALIGPNDGKAQVLIDGKAVATQDQYAPGYSWGTFSYGGLADTFHTVTVKLLGAKDAASSDQVITFDGITVH
jgi:hypothetical protein